MGIHDQRKPEHLIERPGMAAESGSERSVYSRTIDRLDLPSGKKEYLYSRWLGSLTRISRQHRRAELRYRISRLIVVVGGLIVPALISLNFNDRKIEKFGINLEINDAKNSLAIILSVAVAVAAAVDDFFDFGNRAQVRLKTKRKLESEFWGFREGVSSYNRFGYNRVKALKPDLIPEGYSYNPSDGYDLFTRRIESILEDDMQKQLEILREQLREDALANEKILTAQYQARLTGLAERTAAPREVPDGQATPEKQPSRQPAQLPAATPTPEEPEPTGSDPRRVLAAVSEPLHLESLAPELRKALASSLVTIGLLEQVEEKDQAALRQAWQTFKKSERQGRLDMIGPGSISLLIARLDRQDEVNKRKAIEESLSSVKQAVEIESLSSETKNYLEQALALLNYKQGDTSLQEAWMAFKKAEYMGKFEQIGPGSVGRLLTRLGLRSPDPLPGMTPFKSESSLRYHEIPPVSEKSISLQDSVGISGANQARDVEMVKQRLLELGYQTEPGFTITKKDTDSIQLFQSIIKGSAGLISGDGLIEVGRNTHKYLQSGIAPMWMEMPTEGEGFYNYERLEQLNDDHDYGCSWLAEVIEEAGRDYERNYRKGDTSISRIVVNDVSKPYGGRTPDHYGHQCGNVCDLALPRLGGDFGGITYGDPTYDRTSARAMINSLRRQPLVTRILFNDQQLIRENLCTAAPGHDNHIHFEIKNKSLSEPAVDHYAGGVTSTNEASAFSKQCDLRTTLQDDQSLACIAVGYSEGNRDLSGGFRGSYRGHIDPGNAAQNVGSFSSQVKTHNISDPKEADRYWLRKLERELLPAYCRRAQNANLPVDNAFLWLSTCDLYIQAPSAVTDSNGLFDQFDQYLRLHPLSVESMVEARVRSFYDEKGILHAAGFRNSVAALRADQLRRTQAILAAVKTLA